MKKFILLTISLILLIQPSISTADTLENELLNRNKEYLNLFYYAVSLDPSLATEETVKSYISFTTPNDTIKPQDEFERQEIYEARQKKLMQRSASFVPDNTNIISTWLADYDFKKSSFPIHYTTTNSNTNIHLPCIGYGLKQNCVKYYPRHGMPSSITIQFNHADMPTEIVTSPDKAKIFLRSLETRLLNTKIEFSRGLVKTNKEKHRPYTWEIILSPKSYIISTSSNEILFEKIDKEQNAQDM